MKDLEGPTTLDGIIESLTNWFFLSLTSKKWIQHPFLDWSGVLNCTLGAIIYVTKESKHCVHSEKLSENAAVWNY